MTFIFHIPYFIYQSKKVVDKMSTGKTSFSIKTISNCANLSHTSFHNERKEGDRTGSNIDKRRISFNETLHGNDHIDLWKRIASKITGKEFSDEEFYNKKGNSKIGKSDMYYEDGRKMRKDAVLAFECKTHYPGEMSLAKLVDGRIIYLSEEEQKKPPEDSFQWPADMKKFEEWKNITNKFILERFGEERVEQIVLHMDESTPHIHAVVTPSVKDKDGHMRFNMTKMIGGPKECAELQTEYAKSVEHLGFHRGQEFSQDMNKGLNQARHLLTKSLDEKLPDDKELANEMYQAALTQNNKLELELQNKSASATTQSKLRKKNAELEDKIKQLEEQIQEQKKVLQFVEFEKQGLRDLRFSNPKIYEQYQKSKSTIIDLGIDSFDRINMIDRNGDNIDERKQEFLSLDNSEIENH